MIFPPYANNTPEKVIPGNEKQTSGVGFLDKLTKYVFYKFIFQLVSVYPPCPGLKKDSVVPDIIR